MTKEKASQTRIRKKGDKPVNKKGEIASRKKDLAEEQLIRLRALPGLPSLQDLEIMREFWQKQNNPELSKTAIEIIDDLAELTLKRKFGDGALSSAEKQKLESVIMRNLDFIRMTIQDLRKLTDSIGKHDSE